ncbi:MAG: hypothetical protein ACPGJV_07030, partial [Bacteriovoracaceae bacterium]
VLMGASCMGSGNPNVAVTELTGAHTSSKINSFYYDMSSDSCYRSREANSNSTWETYTAPGMVTLGWENFTINGVGSISGFNVYRRLVGESFDYDEPINKETITINISEYQDNADNSWSAPIPNTVYYYEVRPIVGGLSTGTNEIYNTLRVMVPENNQVFVHRWMANQTMCTLLNKDSISISNGGMDPNNHYRCAYEGPGSSTSGYYDIGMDLVVDRYEVGCNYTDNNVCTNTFDGSCIGDNDPTSLTVGAPKGAIFYNRTNGQCYVKEDFAWEELDAFCRGALTGTLAARPGTGALGGLYLATDTNQCFIRTASGWDEVIGGRDSALVSLSQVMFKANSAHLPPLVNVTQREAGAYCASVTGVNNTVGIKTTSANINSRLPNRKEHLIYSQWDTKNTTANSITTTEAGLSLNSSSKCNSNNASGLESFYSDSPVPSSSVFYSLPGTESSGIRSVMTGSHGALLNTFGTESCQSKFGIQDSIGNVSEWVGERMYCSSPTECYGLTLDENRPCPTKSVCGALGTAACSGSGAPTDQVAYVGALYQDTDDNSCYKAISTIGGAGSWQRIDNLSYYDEGKSLALGSNDFKPHSGVVSTQWDVFKLGGTPLDSAGNKYYLGPCKDTNADDICDDSLDGWRFEQELYDAGFMFVPMGLPVHRDFPFYESSDSLLTSMAEIGPTSGITTSDLHDDAFYLNTHEIFADEEQCGAMTVGGGYTDGGDAGSYFFKMIPCSDSHPGFVKGYRIIGDLSYKSIGSSSVSVEYDTDIALDRAFSVTIAGGAISVNYAVVGGVLQTHTAQEIFDALKADAGFNAVADVVISGVATNNQASFTGTLSLNTDLSENYGTDIGFRCVTPIQETDYIAE